MTTLPPPPGYVNQGKGSHRRLNAADQKLIAEYVRYHSKSSAARYFNVCEGTVRRAVDVYGGVKSRRPGNYTTKEIEDMQYNPYEMLRALATRLAREGHTASYVFPGALVYTVHGRYTFRFMCVNGAFVFRLNLGERELTVAPMATLPITRDRRRLEKWVLKVVKDYAHYTPKQRFVLTVGQFHEEFPDIPADVGETLHDGDDVVIWDRQEKRAVVTVHVRYTSLISLEAGARQPFTNIEAWLNNLNNGDLESNGVTATRKAGNQR